MRWWKQSPTVDDDQVFFWTPQGSRYRGDSFEAHVYNNNWVSLTQAAADDEDDENPVTFEIQDLTKFIYMLIELHEASSEHFDNVHWPKYL